MTSTMSPRHVPSIESLRRMPSFTSRGGAADATQHLNHQTQHPSPSSPHSPWTPSLASINRVSLLSAADADAALGMGMHRGAIDRTTVTTQPPARVMTHVARVLQAMGVEIQQESTYRFRCVRPKKGSRVAASEEAAHRGLAAPVPTATLAPISNASLAASQRVPVSPMDDSLPLTPLSPISPMDSPFLQPFVPSAPGATSTNELVEILYGSPADDSHDEVRFSVELTRLEGLSGTYSLDVRRLKGGLRSYSFVYNTIRERASINRL